METKKQRTLAIFALAIALIATTVAYAALSTTLKISGTVTKKGGKWSVYISSVSGIKTTGTATMTKTPTVSGTSTTALNFAASLTKPGDKVEFDFTLANGGSVAAKVAKNQYGNFFNVNSGSFTSSSASAEINDIICKITYNGTVISEENSSVISLAAASGSTPTTKKLHVSCEYNANATSISSNDMTLSFTLSLPYVQA